MNLSLDTGDKVSTRDLREIADRVLEDLGLEDHQVLMVAHGDTGHRHVHLMINRVHTETGLAWPTSHDRHRLRASLKRIERELGFRLTGRNVERQLERRAYSFEQVKSRGRTGRPIFADVVRSLAGEELFHPASFTFTSEGRIYGHYIRTNAESNQIKVLTGEGGAMVYGNGKIYHTLPAGSAIYVYDHDIRRVDIIGNPPSYYRPVTTDIPGRLENPMEEFPQYMQPIFQESTLNTSLFLLGGDRLLMQYNLSNGKVGIDGRRRIDGPIVVDVSYNLRLAKRGKAYQILQPEASSDGRVPNPRIEIYRFNE